MKVQSRYDVLDGLRGIAAIGVMLFHLSIVGIAVVPHGYLAVDFFFMLSGFVLSHAYTNRLSSLGFGNFLRQRLIRIMPLSILGLMLGSSYFIVRYYTQGTSQYSLSDIISATAFNAFLIPKPWVTPTPTDTIFPSNTPLWSLSLEVFVNLAWAYLFTKAKTYRLLVIVLFSILCLTAACMYHGTGDVGATWPTYLGGVSRVMFGFFVGVLIWRHRPRPVESGFYALLSATGLVLILVSPDFGPIFDLVAIVVGFPVVLLIAIRSGFQSKAVLFHFLGDVSYPIYAIHVPLFMYAAGISKLLKIDGYGHAVAAAAILACLAASFLLDRLYDRPLRRALSKLLLS